MPDPTRSLYWDANVFLAYINSDSKERTSIIETLLEDAENKRVEIITSIVSVVEVSFGATEQRGKPLDAEVERNIARLFAPESSPVTVVELHRHIAEKAKRLVRSAREQGFSLKPMDAIHPSTAQQQGSTEFHTYDLDQLAKFAKDTSLVICEPYVTQQRLDLT